MQPKSDPTRPLIVPQEYLINNDDMSPYESIPEKVENTLPQLKPLLTKPMQETEKVFYQTLSNEKKYLHRTTFHSCTFNNLYY